MDFSLLTSEITFIVFSLIVLLSGIFKLNISFELGIIGCVLSLALQISIFIIKDVNNVFIIDPFSSFLKILFLSLLLIIFLFSKDFLKGGKNHSEYCFFLMMATLGMMLLVSSNDMIILYIAFELISISCYILTSFLKDKNGIEGGIKYLLFGAFSGAFLIYGLSLIYGLTGTTNLLEAKDILMGLEKNLIQVLAIIFILAGICFKADIVPFHMWIPDVYQGAPTPITAFLATSSKIAGFGIIIRLFLGPLGAISFDVERLFFILSLITIILGNLLAIPQRNIKRLLGYSSISHAGYLLIGLCVYGGQGLIAILFYFVAYAIATISSFLVISVTKYEEIDDYNGFSKRNPIMAFLMLLSLSSLAGIPPFVGFFGKFSLFYAAINKGLIILAIIGVIFSVVSIYYYFIIIKAIYFGNTEKGAIYIPPYITTLTLLLIISLIIFGLFPNPIVDLVFFVNERL